MVLHKAGALMGYKLHSLDGEIGKVKDLLFDDLHWTIRYLVADTGSWLESRQVLLSPLSLRAVSEDEHHISINLSNQQIADSPLLETNMPVSRQFEEDYFEYYGWPMYWSAPFMWGSYPNANFQAQTDEASPTIGEQPAHDQTWDPHLCSTVDIGGQHIQAGGHDIGSINDFIIDDAGWAIRYLVIDTGHWWSGKYVLISPRWIERADWVTGQVALDVTREQIEQAPEYSAKIPITREDEIRLFRHYQRQGYWVEDYIPVFRH